MKVLYDYQIFDMQVTGGISRYHADLYQGGMQNNVVPILGLKYTSNIYLAQQGLDFYKSFTAEENLLSGFNFKYKHDIFRVLRKFGLNPKSSWNLNAQFCRECLKNNEYDIFHPTYYDDLYSDVQIKAPIVLTIHDMIYEGYTQFFNEISVINRKKMLAERANAIIAISEYTKNEILKYYDNIDEAKIHVVHHGIDLSDIEDYTISETKGDFILYVGDRWGYKDFYTLLRAIKILKQQNRDIKLITVGRPFYDSESSYIDFLGLKDCVRHLGRVSDNELIELYKNAQLIVSTSMAEGFGLPLLECMKYGTPMVLSDIPVYREVASDSALYYKTCDDKSLADVICQLYNNGKMQKELIAEGRKRLMFYDKNDMVKKTLDVYKILLK